MNNLMKLMLENFNKELINIIPVLKDHYIAWYNLLNSWISTFCCVGMTCVIFNSWLLCTIVGWAEIWCFLPSFLVCCIVWMSLLVYFMQKLKCKLNKVQTWMKTTTCCFTFNQETVRDCRTVTVEGHLTQLYLKGFSRVCVNIDRQMNIILT